MRRARHVVPVLLLWSAAACAGVTSWEAESTRAAPAAGTVAEDAEGASGFASLDQRGRLEGEYRGPGDTAPPSPTAADVGVSPRDRKMIYTAQMTVEVARPEEAIERFTARIEEWGGYLSGRRDTSITCRVPAERFEEALAELRGYGPVLNQSMQASDVTKQHMDLSIRLENARKGRDRLLALLEKADKVEDILKIEEQLRRLTEEIERLEGELKYLDDQVAYSTITASFQAVAPPANGPRRRSHFHWINMVGPEHVRTRF